MTMYTLAIHICIYKNNKSDTDLRDNVYTACSTIIPTLPTVISLNIKKSRSASFPRLPPSLVLSGGGKRGP